MNIKSCLIHNFPFYKMYTKRCQKLWKGEVITYLFIKELQVIQRFIDMLDVRIYIEWIPAKHSESRTNASLHLEGKKCSLQILMRFTVLANLNFDLVQIKTRLSTYINIFYKTASGVLSCEKSPQLQFVFIIRNGNSKENLPLNFSLMVNGICLFRQLNGVWGCKHLSH